MDHLRENVHSPAISSVTEPIQSVTGNHYRIWFCIYFSCLNVSTHDCIYSAGIQSPPQLCSHPFKNAQICFNYFWQKVYTIVLALSNENEVPRGNRRQELHLGLWLIWWIFTQIGMRLRSERSSNMLLVGY